VAGGRVGSPTDFVGTRVGATVSGGREVVSSLGATVGDGVRVGPVDGVRDSVGDADGDGGGDVGSLLRSLSSE
jgi:hypothetical protein